MRRGDIVSVAYGKPRPSVVVQADNLPTPVEILLCPFTTHVVDAPIYRIAVEPDPENGLKQPSQIMVDKVGPAPRDKIGAIIGRLAPSDVAKLDAALLTILDLSGD